EVRLFVSDLGKPSEFLKFQLEEIDKHRPFLLIPREGKLPLESRLRRIQTPKDFEAAKTYPNETVIIRLEFEPIDKTISQDEAVVPRSMINEIWFKYKDFPPLKLARTHPVDDQITRFLVEEISLGNSGLFLIFGLFVTPLGTIFGLSDRAKKYSAILGLPGSSRNTGLHGQQEETSVDAKNAVPTTWESDVIINGFRRFVTKPRLLDIYVKEITKRFIIGQDDRTAKKRIEFLKTRIEELRLTRDLESCLDDLSLREINLRIAQLELEIKEANLEGKRRRQEELAELEHQRDVLKVKVEIARSEKEIRDLQTPASKPQKQKSRTKKDIEAEISRANADEQRI